MTRLKAIRRALLLGAVLLTPLAYTPGLLVDVYNLPKLTLLSIAVALGGALRLAEVALGADGRGLRLLALPAVAMGTAVTISWLVSDFRGWSLFGLYVRYGGLIPYLVVIIFAVLVADAFAGNARPVVYALVIGASGVGLVALVQMLFFGAQIGRLSETAYVASTIGHSNYAGGYLAMMLPLAISVWLEEDRHPRWGLAATVIIASGLLFTLSQGAWLAGIGGVATLIALRLDETRRFLRRLALLVTVGSGAAGVVAILWTMSISHPVGRVPGFLMTAASRGFLWEHALEVGFERPLAGWGPNVFAIQGPLHRSIEDALLQGFVKGTDPHSVPLAIFANLGLLGLTAFALIFVWVVRGGLRRERSSPLAAGISAALVAYLIQASVSVDELIFRFGLWVLLAASAAWWPYQASPARGDTNTIQRSVAVAVFILGAAAVVLTWTTLPLADWNAKQGINHFRQGRPEAGRAAFLQALEARDDYEYRRLYAGTLGNYAFREGPSAEPFIDEMIATFKYLDDFPDPQALTFYGELLNQWSLHEPSASDDALTVLRRAQQLDPYNPLVALDIADVLLQQGRYEDAEAVLTPHALRLDGSFPEFSERYSEFWSALAIARIEQGDLLNAKEALEKAGPGGGCRFFIATELLWVAEGTEPTDQFPLFICPSTLRLLLPGGAEQTANRAT